MRSPQLTALLFVSPLALAVAIATPVAAQDLTAEQDAPAASGDEIASGDAQLSEIVVTGSRIRGVGPVGSSVITVGRADISESGAQTTAQLLQQVPQIFNLGVSENSRGQSGGAGNTTFGSSVNIRGIGPYTTLTILNGHRTVPQGTSGFAVDPSVIPTLALERVEVVADGASAIYGSDAVAGVVNLILRRNFEGVQFSGTYGFASDYTERQLGMIAGHKWSTGQFTLAAQYDDHSSLNSRDRDYVRADLTARGGSDFRVAQCNPGTITVDGVNYAIPAGGLTTANRSSLIANTRNLCDGVPDVDLIPEIERYSASATFDQEITENLSIYADAFAAYRKFRFNETSVATALTVPSTNAFFIAPPGLTPSSMTVNYSFAGTLPQPVRQGTTKTYNGTIGARLTLPKSWQLDGDFTYGYNEDISNQHNVSIASALTAALASSDPATAFNPFGGPNSPSVIDSIISGKNVSSGSSKFMFYQVSANGPLLSLPGGDVRAVIGYEGQNLIVDQNQIQGTITAPIVVPGNPKHATRNVNSGFVELFVPLFGGANAAPGLEKLEISGAIRYDRYSDVGSTTNPKVGLNYSPVQGLTFRGSYGTSFRAPGIAQIYGNTNTLYIRSFPDPTIGNAIRQGVVRTGGNLDLVPETATTYSFGAELQPAFARRLRLSATYFDIVYENQVVQYLTDFTILQRESDFAGTGIITRNPSAELIAQNVAETQYTGIIPANISLYVDGRSRNLGKTVARGLDFSASYTLPTDNAGTFTLNVDGTYFLAYKVAVSSSSPLNSQLNVIFNPLRFRARGQLSWSKGPLDITTNVYFNNAYRIISPVAPDIAAQMLVDLNVGLNLEKISPEGWTRGLNLGLNIRNLLDSDPPFVNLAPSATTGGGFDPTLTSPVGRLVALSISKKF